MAKVDTKKIASKIKKAIKTNIKPEEQALRRTQKQALGKIKKRKYSYASEATKQKAIQRGKALRATFSQEQLAQIEEKRKRGLENYRQAQKIAKTDSAYKKYWEEVKALKKQARALGKNLSIEKITGSPLQIKEAYLRNESLTPETQARFALGLATRIDVANLMQRAEEAGVIKKVVYNGELVGCTYDGKGYSVQDMQMMMSSPRTFFKPKSKFWNWINELYWQNGGGDDAAEVVASEVFGS